ncbi:trans-aconitate 2-methyltransferase [soil metagenome]
MLLRPGYLRQTATMTDRWDPDRYHQFQAERRQPFDDLLAMVAPAPGGRAVDLGCGSGELTVELHRHLGAAETVGVDTSPTMLESAAAHGADGLTFAEGDLATWLPANDPVDVALANASLQWVDDHPTVLGRWRDGLVPGGQLAVQVPANFDHPSHTVAEEVGRTFGLDPISRFEAVLSPEGYAERLDHLGFEAVHVRLQVYLHHLASTAALIDWVRGTLLTRYQRDLGDERFAEFLEQYGKALLERIGDPAGHRPYLHLFKRILFTARKPEIA